MTEDQIKEALSNNYVSCLANRLGFKLVKSDWDTGVDYTIVHSIKRQMPVDKEAQIDSPYTIDIQLKSTTTKSINLKGNIITYQLRAKNYNDLIYRRQIGHTPLVLILFILPEDEDEWVKVLEDKLVLSKNAYWYYPSDSETTEVKNSSSKTIKIPITNKLDFSFFNSQVKKWIPEWK